MELGGKIDTLQFSYFWLFFLYFILSKSERENIHCLQVKSTSYFWLCLGLSMLEGEFFSQCWIPVVLKLQKQRRKQLRTDQFRGSGLTPLPQELLSSNLMSSQCQMVRRTGKNTDNTVNSSVPGKWRGWYIWWENFLIFQHDYVFNLEKHNKKCVLSSILFFSGFGVYFIRIYVVRPLLLFQKLWNDRVKVRCASKFSQYVLGTSLAFCLTSSTGLLFQLHDSPYSSHSFRYC